MALNEVVADHPADARSVILADGTRVTGDDIPTANALESRKFATTLEEVTAEALETADDDAEGAQQIAVDTTPTPVEAIEEQADMDAKRSRKEAPKAKK